MTNLFMKLEKSIRKGIRSYFVAISNHVHYRCRYESEPLFLEEVVLGFVLLPFFIVMIPIMTPFWIIWRGIRYVLKYFLRWLNKY